MQAELWTDLTSSCIYSHQGAGGSVDSRPQIRCILEYAIRYSTQRPTALSQDGYRCPKISQLHEMHKAGERISVCNPLVKVILTKELRDDLHTCARKPRLRMPPSSISRFFGANHSHRGRQGCNLTSALCFCVLLFLPPPLLPWYVGFSCICDRLRRNFVFERN